MVIDENKPKNNETKNEHGLTELEQKVVEMYVYDGKSIIKIAEELHKHRNTISKWLHKPELVAEQRRCAEELARQTRDEMNNYIAAHGMKILENYMKLALSTDKRVSAQCSQYLLDRFLGKASAKVEIDANIDSSDIIPSADDIMQRLKDRKLEVLNSESSAESA